MMIMRNRIWVVKYWKEISDEKRDFEKEVEGRDIKEALSNFEKQTSRYRIESIIEKI